LPPETEPENKEVQKERYNQMRSFLGNDISDASIRIFNASGFEISSSAAKPFVDFTNWINARPYFIREWRSTPKTEQTLYPRFMTVTGGVRSAYSAVCYHLMRIKEIESSVDRILSEYDFSKTIGKSQTMGFGNMIQLDFEYHSYVLAYRRCLDYMAFGISTYFNQQQSSYNKKFRKFLEKAQPRLVADALLSVYDAHLENFSFVLGTERGKSLRDRIGHSEFVSAASINITATGHHFIGGGEGIGINNSQDSRSLSKILDDRAYNLHKFITEFLNNFQESVDKYEETLPKKKKRVIFSPNYSYYKINNDEFYIKVATKWIIK